MRSKTSVSAAPKAKRTRKTAHRAKVSKLELRRALAEHGGLVGRVAEAFSVSRQTIYNWIEKYGLRDALSSSRTLMFDLAEDNVFRAVEAGDLDISKFVLTHMPSTRRWSSRAEVTGADGAPLALPADVVEMLAALGVSPSDVAKQFEAMIREQAAAAKAATHG